MQRLNKKMFLKTQIEWRKSKEGKEKQISKMQNKMRKLEKTYNKWRKLQSQKHQSNKMKMKRIEKITQKNLIEYKKEKQKDKIINKEEKNKINSIQNIGKIDQKSDPNLQDISIINQKVDSKNNLLEGSFVDDKIIKLTKDLKDITKKVTETEDKIFKDKSEENSNDN